MMLSHIWYSTNNLYERYGLTAENVPPLQRQNFLNEEAHELLQASTILDTLERMQAAPEDTTDVRRNLLEEAADVMVTVMGLLQAHNISYPAFEAACLRKVSKNDAKTEANGYVYRDGKIRKVTDGRQETK